VLYSSTTGTGIENSIQIGLPVVAIITNRIQIGLPVVAIITIYAAKSSGLDLPETTTRLWFTTSQSTLPRSFVRSRCRQLHL
jgi:hypothetical protein